MARGELTVCSKDDVSIQRGHGQSAICFSPYGRAGHWSTEHLSNQHSLPPHWNWSTDCVPAMCSKCNPVYIKSLVFDNTSKAHVWGRNWKVHQFFLMSGHTYNLKQNVDKRLPPFRIGRVGKKLSDEAKRQKADSRHLNLSTLLQGKERERGGRGW